MHIIIDLVIVALIAFCVWRGWKNGIVIGVVSIVAVIASLVIGNVVATVYSHEFSGMLKPFVDGIVDGVVGDTLSGKAAKKDEIVIQLDSNERQDVSTVTFAAMRRLGLSEATSASIADKAEQKVNAVGSLLTNEITMIFCDMIAYVLVFFVVFILAIILFTVIGNLINLSFKLPGLELVNQITGAVLGLGKGILFVLLISAALRYAGLMLPEKDIEKTVILNYFINNNFIANLLGI